MVDELPNRAAAAKAAGKSRDQLYAYINGTSEPSFLALAALAEETGFSLDWLATGRGEKLRQERAKPLPYDEKRMRICMKIAKALADSDALEEGYTEERFATALYGLMMRLPPANPG